MFNNHFGIEGDDAGDFARVLGDDARDGGGAVAVVLMEGFEIGLDAGTTAIIGAGDGEDGWGVGAHVNSEDEV